MFLSVGTVTATTDTFAEFRNSGRVCASSTRCVSLLLPSPFVPEQNLIKYIVVLEQDAYWCCQSRRQQTRSSSPCFHEGEHGVPHPPLQSMFRLFFECLSLTYRCDSSSVRVTLYLQVRPTALSRHPKARWLSISYRAYFLVICETETDILGNSGMAQTAPTDAKFVPPGLPIWRAPTS